MPSFLEIASTPAVQAAQAAHGSREHYQRIAESRRHADRLGPDERDFISTRESFYLSTVSETGWPYIQHRGGPAGFLRVLDDQTLAFADFRGNRQYISVGNLATNDKAALILVDYPSRSRLKLYAHASERSLADDPALAAALALPGYKAVPERAFVLRVVAFDWNCSQHITPRFSVAELASMQADVDAER